MIKYRGKIICIDYFEPYSSKKGKNYFTAMILLGCIHVTIHAGGGSARSKDKFRLRPGEKFGCEIFFATHINLLNLFSPFLPAFLSPTYFDSRRIFIHISKWTQLTHISLTKVTLTGNVSLYLPCLSLVL